MTAHPVAERVYNFSAGPAVLPVTALEQIRDEMLAAPNCGASILEISHRSPQFRAILQDASQRLRQLLAIPADYEVLFLQGGARLQFSMVPMNLLRGSSAAADYVVTGSWGSKALAEAKKEGPVRLVWDGKSTNYDRLPTGDDLKFGGDAPYVHVTSNETIQGVQFSTEPETGASPLVCDASSDFLCRPLPVEKYGLIYACAQKNAGPSGLTVVIIRKDLLSRSQESLPGYLSYAEHAQEGSLYNTPNTFGIYAFGLVAKWLQEDVGGLAAMHAQNRAKAKMLYDVIDQTPDFYRAHAASDCRSLMNVTFRLANDELQSDFLQQAADVGLCELKGHRSVGGIRASIYNAMPAEGVATLRDFMVDFRDRRG